MGGGVAVLQCHLAVPRNCPAGDRRPTQRVLRFLAWAHPHVLPLPFSSSSVDAGRGPGPPRWLYCSRLHPAKFVSSAVASLIIQVMSKSDGQRGLKGGLRIKVKPSLLLKTADHCSLRNSTCKWPITHRRYISFDS